MGFGRSRATAKIAAGTDAPSIEELHAWQSLRNDSAVAAAHERMQAFAAREREFETRFAAFGESPGAAGDVVGLKKFSQERGALDVERRAARQQLREAQAAALERVRVPLQREYDARVEVLRPALDALRKAAEPLVDLERLASRFETSSGGNFDRARSPLTATLGSLVRARIEQIEMAVAQHRRR